MAQEEPKFSENLTYLHRLSIYLEYRDIAVGREEPSNLSSSMNSYIFQLTSVGFLTSVRALGEAADLMNTITKNRAKAERLIKKVERTKSIKRARTWYSIVVRLYQEAEEAGERLKELENG